MEKLVKVDLYAMPNYEFTNNINLGEGENIVNNAIKSDLSIIGIVDICEKKLHTNNVLSYSNLRELVTGREISIYEHLVSRNVAWFHKEEDMQKETFTYPEETVFANIYFFTEYSEDFSRSKKDGYSIPSNEEILKYISDHTDKKEYLKELNDFISASDERFRKAELSNETLTVEALASSKVEELKRSWPTSRTRKKK